MENVAESVLERERGKFGQGGPFNQGYHAMGEAVTTEDLVTTVDSVMTECLLIMKDIIITEVINSMITLEINSDESK